MTRKIMQAAPVFHPTPSPKNPSMMPSKAYLADTLGTSFCSIPELHFYRRHCPHSWLTRSTLPGNKRFSLSFLNPFFVLCHVLALHIRKPLKPIFNYFIIEPIYY